MPAIAALIRPTPHDLGGGFIVRRALPAPGRRAVGPFVFLDQMGPVVFAPGHGIEVRPHPHIGLATITYLFDGEILHRDSLGFVQPIRPGEVNWMSAGKGIVHSERTAPERRAAGGAVFGLQAWVALPLEAEESEPSFDHFAAGALPHWRDGTASFTLVAGEAYGRKSPARTLSPLFYIDAKLDNGASFAFEDSYPERALYVAAGAVAIEGEAVEAGHLAVLEPDREVCVTAGAEARVMLMGGAALDAPRTVWWNFVSSRKDRIEEAKALWRAGGFTRIPGDDEFIPLPEP